MDGLVYSKDAYRLLVTSPYLLRHFLASHPKLPGSIDKLARDENLYSYAFDWDAGLDRFTEIPLGPQARGTTVYAFAGAWVQDDALVVPDTLAVFVARGNRIYLATHPITPSLQQISTCEGRWNSYDQKAQTSADAAKRAGSTQVYAQANRYWQQGYRAYRQCWKQEARKQAGFAALKQQAREIVRELLKAPG